MLLLLRIELRVLLLLMMLRMQLKMLVKIIIMMVIVDDTFKFLMKISSGCYDVFLFFI